jgi:hypothetical protein
MPDNNPIVCAIPHAKGQLQAPADTTLVALAFLPKSASLLLVVRYYVLRSNYSSTATTPRCQPAAIMLPSETHRSRGPSQSGRPAPATATAPSELGRDAATSHSQALFNSEKISDFGIVVFSFVCGKYCLIIN